MAEDEAEILVQRGLVLQWQGPSMYESQDDLNARDAAGISPGRETKTLRLLRQLGPQTIDGPVWLCETLDGQGRAVHVVLKLFSPTLWAKPDLEYYVSHAWTAEVLWRRIPGPEYVRRTNMPVLNVLSSLSSRTAMYRENTAYARLKHMQGDAIPISYGFYRVSLGLPRRSSIS